jgi:hypothetical protein
LLLVSLLGLVGEIDDVATDAVLQEVCVEIHEQTQALVGKFHAGVELCFVNGKQCGHGFEFDDDCFIHKKVNPTSFLIERFTLVDHRECHLPA